MKLGEAIALILLAVALIILGYVIMGRALGWF